MNTSKIFFVSLFIIALFASCSLERPIGTEPNGTSSGIAKVKIHVNVPEMDSKPVGTRSTGIVEMHVMTFDATLPSLPMTDAPQVATIEDAGTPLERYFVASLNASSTPRLVLVIVNAGNAINDLETFLGGWMVVGEDDGGGVPVIPATATTFADVEANLKSLDLSTIVLGSNTYIDEQPAVAPMTGRVTVPDISAGMVITQTGGLPVDLTRATARFTIEVPTPIPNFSILGASMGNAPLNGFILPHSPIPAAASNYHNAHSSSTNEGAGYVPIVGALGGGNRADTLYCYEDSKVNNHFIILRANYMGVPGYYRINIVEGAPNDDPSARPQMDIERNTWYKIMIMGVNNYGYSTLLEAINNRATNILFEVTATVPYVAPYEDIHDDAHDIISNRDYFLGVSNSTFYAFCNDNLSLMSTVATTLTHSATGSVTTANVSITPGVGLNLIHPTTSALVTSFDFNPAIDKKIAIAISMGSAFKYASTGKITITLGGLVKEIEIVRKPSLSYMQGVINDFALLGTCVTALPTTDPPSSWLRFSQNPSGTSPAVEITDSPTANIYVVHAGNISLSGATERSAYAYFAQNNNLGRIKAYFAQGFLNIDDIVDTRIVPSYAGAFWRAAQKGERMIRIPVGTYAGNVGPWRAEVVWLDSRWNAALSDGVVVDADGFTSGELSARSISWSSVTTPQDAEGFSLPGAALSASGTAVTNGYIEFRLGAQKGYLSSPLYPARYGLVLLTYGTPEKTQKIYLRQGEEPDYLMRPGDPAGGSGSVADNRAFATKFSPYNLSAPTSYIDPTTVLITGSPNVGLAFRGGVFTDYPSQAGYFFRWNQNRQAYAPHITTLISNWTALPMFTEYWITSDTETCPPNYRRPQDGSVIVHNPTGPVAGSEMRQSLWLDPLSGSGTNSSSNSVWGYYADGFFDRRQIVNGPAGADTPGTSSTVSVSTRDIAHIGNLFYNPTTFASLFLPASGDLLSDNASGKASYHGTAGLYWTSTSVNLMPPSAWCALVMGTTPLAFLSDLSDKGVAMSVRCVSCVPISSVSLNASTSSAPIGSLITLTATNYSDVRYLWEFYDGTDWQPLATTTTNSYVATVLKVGAYANPYRVTLAGGCNDATSAPVYIAGTHPTAPEADPNMPMYVGAYWRANQTGERVVYVTMGPGTDATDYGPWTAVVSWLDDRWGINDGVVLSKAKSADPNIRTSTPAIADPTYQVYPASDSTLIMGSVGAGGAIEFRIGLKSTFNAPTFNPTTPDTLSTFPARYGVVLLSYGQGKMRRIFIRQGEGDDWVMRPTDPINSGGMNQSTRPNAMKLSPYNIKDNQHRIPSQRNNVYFSANSGVFVEYPSMIGYLFSFNGSYFGCPSINGLNVGGWNIPQMGVQGYWSSNATETCPTGYRRPNDGSTSGIGAATVTGSEIRQSLWLNPQSNGSPLTGASTSNMDNSVGGLYADGYYDRGVREDGTTPVSPSGGQNTVRWNFYSGAYPPTDLRVFIAAAGRLVYNPRTNGSIFMPASGINTGSNIMVLAQIGEDGGYWTSTAYSVEQGNTTGYASQVTYDTDPNGSSGLFRMHYHEGSYVNPVRCVRQ